MDGYIKRLVDSNRIYDILDEFENMDRNSRYYFIKDLLEEREVVVENVKDEIDVDTIQSEIDTIICELQEDKPDFDTIRHACHSIEFELA